MRQKFIRGFMSQVKIIIYAFIALFLAVNMAYIHRLKTANETLKAEMQIKQATILGLENSIKNHEIAIKELSENYNANLELQSEIKSVKDSIIKQRNTNEFKDISEQHINQNLSNSVDFIYQRVRPKAN